MLSSRTVVLLLPLAAFAYAAAFVAFEYFNGGVRTHHFLARGDLPGFSNWLALLVLPLLGIVLAVHEKSEQGGSASGVVSRTLVSGTTGSLAYGTALAASFHFGLGQVSLVLFLGLFLFSIALSVYRAEYIFGFVVGMTIAFGSVIPLAFALLFATVSFVLRRVWVLVVTAARKHRQ